MADETESRPTPLGIYDHPQPQGVSRVEVIALILSLLWLGGSTAFFLSLEPGDADQADSLRFMMTLMAVFLPIAMIWVAATAARSTRVMREESRRLQTAIDAMRRTYVAQAQGQHLGAGAEPSVSRKLDEIAAAQRKTETALATFSTSRSRDEGIRKQPESEEPVALEDQGLLALGTPSEELSPPLPKDDFIRALNFPETTEDTEGFSALRRALRDRQAKQLIQASQDVLTLLSQDGIYMDDLRPDPARPEVWRRFAAGERGRSVAALGGIRDRSSLALSAGRMKQDSIFRDAAHHFLRSFDKTFSEFEETASDSDIAMLTDTRTARAFMLLGRVAGTFD